MDSSKRKYQHLFFDLDRTLWDFDRNSREALSDLYNFHRLAEKRLPEVLKFIDVYERHNLELWERYRVNDITKKELIWRRFYDVFIAFGLDDRPLAECFSRDYLSVSVQKKHLFPYTLEILEGLKGRYTLHLITNGFEEVQFKKLENSGLTSYFKTVVTSEACGYKKPDARIFNYALEKTGANSSDSLMIGDDFQADILGAKGVGMDQLFFNLKREVVSENVTYEVNSLKEIIKIL